MATLAHFIQSMRRVYLLTSFLFYQQAHLMLVHTIVNIHERHHLDHHHSKHHFSTHIQAPLSIHCVVFVAGDKYTKHHIDMLLSRSWIDSIILIGVCCPMFSSNDKRKKNLWYIEFFSIYRKKSSYVCALLGILHAEALLSSIWQQEKITKWCTESEKNRAHSRKLDDWKAGSSNGELIWYCVTQGEKKTIQSRIHSFVM